MSTSKTFPLIAPLPLLMFGVCALILCTTGCLRPKQTLTVAPAATIRFDERWTLSEVKYTNAQELVRRSHRSQAGAVSPQPTASPRVRIVITTEPRTSFADATKRLVDIAVSRSGTSHVYAIGGWPAVESNFTELMPRRGDRDGSEIMGPPPLLRRAVVAIAFDNEVIKFDIWPSSEDTERLLQEAISVARTFKFSSRENPDELRATLASLRQEIQRHNDLGANRTAGGSGFDRPPVSPGPPGGGAQPGSAVHVQGGAGELEVAASTDATKIVIASNSALSFSSDSGATFHGGNTGIFGLNDPSVSQAVSGSFYLGVIASPTGSADQLNVTGCTNAVSESTDGGATFALQGYSTICPESGNGMCFPDQPHVTGDVFNPSSGSAGGDQLYVVWRNVTAVWPSTPSDCNAINSFDSITSSITCSQDGGKTWTSRASISGAGDFPRVAVGMDGKVYVISLSGNGVLLNRFTSCANGLTLEKGFPVTVTNLNGTVSCPVPGLDRCNDGNTLSSPMVAPDPSNASHLAVSFAENDGHNGERVVTMDSLDAGLTFPNRTIVSAPSSARRFMPWSCPVLGSIAVGWYDRGAANASGATNDLTDYVLAGPAIAGVINLSNNPDPQCAAGWPCGTRSQDDSKSCTVQPELAGICQTTAKPAPTCDFKTGGCPSGESCQTGTGCPKYGDYNGIACANNSVIAAWTSATAPQGLPPVTGLQVFSTVVPLLKSVATPTFDRVSISLTTGHDNAGSGVEITGMLSGQSSPICLKPSTSLPSDGICSNGSGATDHNDKNTWDNWAISTQLFPLDTQQTSAAGFGTIDITLLQSGCGLSCDNWDIQGITITAIDSTGTLPPTSLIGMLNPNNGDNCIARLKGAPNATIVRFGLNGTNTHIYVNGTASETGQTTNCKNNGDGG